jgi:hypothetical protein
MFMERNVHKNSLAKASTDRLFEIIHLQPQKTTFPPSSSLSLSGTGIYGLGSERDTKKFFSTFGIHVQEKVTEKHLCDFVSTGSMHNLFQKHVRPDRMGVNYNNVHFRYHELLNIHELYNN